MAFVFSHAIPEACNEVCIYLLSFFRFVFGRQLFKNRDVFVFLPAEAESITYLLADDLASLTEIRLAYIRAMFDHAVIRSDVEELKKDRAADQLDPY